MVEQRVHSALFSACLTCRRLAFILFLISAVANVLTLAASLFTSGRVRDATGFRSKTPAGAAGGLDGLALMFGMLVETYFATGSRSMLSFLVKPLGGQLARAFREV